MPHLGPALAPSEAIPNLNALAGYLVPILRGGFECRLSADDPQVDLQQCVVSADRELELLHELIASAASEAEGVSRSAWRSLQQFFETLTHSASSLNRALQEVWLEF